MNGFVMQVLHVFVLLFGAGWLPSPFAVRVLLFAEATSTTTKMTAVQANFGDITFAGAMAWEPVTDLLYLTGQVGENACWMGILKRTPSMQFVSKVVLPEPAICQDLLVVDTKNVLLLALTEEGGLFTDTRPNGSTKATQYGLVIPLTYPNGRPESVQLQKGLLMHADPVQTPRSILSDPIHEEIIYVASLNSESGALSESFVKSTDTVPNLTPGGLNKFGREFFLQVERIQYSTTNHNLQAQWRKPYGLTPIKQDGTLQQSQSVWLANMIWNQGALVIAGSTRGQGLLFGHAEPVNATLTTTTAITMDYCMNGFVSKLDPTTGRLWQSSSSPNNVKRYSRASDTDTFIEAICSSSPDAKDLYVTGHYSVISSSKNGKPSKSIPFLYKMDANTLEILWEESFPFTQNAYGISCGVDDANDAVYLAGIVEQGGSYGADTTSLGQDDVFVIKARTTDGHGDWIRQIGTQGNDRLAHGGGNGLMVLTSDTTSSGDDSGGVILFGDTTSDLQATNRKGTEVFVVFVDRNGQVSWTTTETSSMANDGGSVKIQVPHLNDDSTTTDGGAPLVDQGGTGGGIGMIIAVVVLVAVLATGYYIVRSRKQETVTERAVVFSYLHAFDLEDVDVRHSATGGWHGTYVGDLAKGKGLAMDSVSRDGRGHRSNRLSHSSIVTDSLFVDYDTLASRRSQNGMEGDLAASRENYCIGSEEEEDDETLNLCDMDPDFDEIGKLDEQLSGDYESAHKPWGRDII